MVQFWLKKQKKCLKNNNCEDVSINMNVWIKCIHCPASTSINMSCTTTVPTMADTSPLLTLFNRGWRWWWWGCCWTSWTLDQKVWVAIYFFMRNLAWFLGFWKKILYFYQSSKKFSTTYTTKWTYVVLKQGSLTNRCYNQPSLV